MNLQAYEVEFLETASQIPNDLWDACFQPQPRTAGGTKPSINPASKTSTPFLWLDKRSRLPGWNSADFRYGRARRPSCAAGVFAAIAKKADELRAAMIVWKDFPESSSADLSRFFPEDPVAVLPGNVRK